MNNEITMEKIDQVKSRIPNITYAQAKEALVQANGDVVEAIILLEENHMINMSKKAKKMMDDMMPKDSSEFKDDLKEIGEQVKELLKRSSVIRVIVEKNNKTIINIPLTVGVVGIAWGPIYALIGLSAAIITKYQIKIQNEEDGTEVNLGQLNEEKLDLLKQMMTNTAKDIKETVYDSKKDDKDITDELFEEHEVFQADEIIDKK